MSNDLIVSKEFALATVAQNYFQQLTDYPEKTILEKTPITYPVPNRN